MTLDLNKRDLLNALTHFERIIPSRPSTPAHGLLHVILKSGQLQLIGTNGDIDLLADLPVDSQDEGSWLLPVGPLAKLVKALSGDLVTLEFTETELQLKAGTFKSSVTLADDEFPALPFATEFEHEISGNALKAALEGVSYAAARATYQQVFRGVKLELGEQSRTVATDGFRLAYNELGGISGKAEAVIDARLLDTLRRLVGETVQFTLSDTALQVRSGIYTATVRTLEGTFPQYRAIIPSTAAIRIVADATTLSEVISRAALVADPDSNNRVDLTAADDQLTVSSQGAYGASTEKLDIEHEGENITVAYNVRYLTEALANLSGAVELGFTGVNSPTLIKQSGQDGNLAMVVPLRTEA